MIYLTNVSELVGVKAFDVNVPLRLSDVYSDANYVNVCYLFHVC